jgi:hypothetical protein
MAEQERVETTPSVETQPEETLENVLKDIPVEQVAQSFNAAPRQPEAAPSFDIPDPTYDSDGFKSKIGEVGKATWEVKQSVDGLRNEIDSLRAERQRTVEQADLGKVVSEIQEAVPSLAGKDRIVQAHLGAYAQEDPRIAKAWEQRGQNPAAWNKVLGVLKREIAKEYDFQADPQLTENVKAAKASRDQMATTQKPDADEKWQKASPAEFQKMWDNLTNSQA